MGLSMARWAAKGGCSLSADRQAARKGCFAAAKRGEGEAEGGRLARRAQRGTEALRFSQGFLMVNHGRHGRREKAGCRVCAFFILNQYVNFNRIVKPSRICYSVFMIV